DERGGPGQAIVLTHRSGRSGGQPTRLSSPRRGTEGPVASFSPAHTTRCCLWCGLPMGVGCPTVWLPRAWAVYGGATEWSPPFGGCGDVELASSTHPEPASPEHRLGDGARRRAARYLAAPRPAGA